MTNEQISILASIYAEVAVVEGMKAENMARESLGESMAYTDGDFFYVQKALIALSVRAMNT